MILPVSVPCLLVRVCIWLIMLFVRVPRRFVTLSSRFLVVCRRVSVVGFASVLTWWTFVVEVSLFSNMNVLTLLACRIRALLYSLTEQALPPDFPFVLGPWFTEMICILLLHPLLNSVRVFSVCVLLGVTMWALMGAPRWTTVPILVLTRISLLVDSVCLRSKLKCSWLLVPRSFPRAIRLFSVVCSVLPRRRAVERPV